MSGKKAGRGVLGAQARSLKKAWRRVQVNSSLLVQQLLHHLSLGSTCSSSSMNVVYKRLQQQEPVRMAVSADDYDNNDQNADSICRITQFNVDADDELQYSNAGSCCIHMNTRSLLQHFPYQPLISSTCRQDSRRHDHPDHRSAGASPSSLNSFTTLSSPSRPSSLTMTTECEHSGTVILKVSIVGDSETGKTTFIAKYVWPEGTSPEMNVETAGVATQEKAVHVKSRGTHIVFSLWDLGGHWQCGSMLPMVCRDAAAILIMFDLTRRSTLNSVMDWFVQVRDCNKAAIAVMIGTKYDQFVELPLDIQRAVVQQARVYARAMGAPLFFSSATHNINVQKVFKVIVAKLFDLPCPIPTNLNFGEPLVDY